MLNESTMFPRFDLTHPLHANFKFRSISPWLDDGFVQQSFERFCTQQDLFFI